MIGNRLLPTSEDTIGPYYPQSFCVADRADLMLSVPGTVFRPIGQSIILTGRILDVSGEPVFPAVVEYWYADAAGSPPGPGQSSDPHFAGFAREYLHGEHYCLHTIKPGAMQSRAPHITVTLFCDGITRLVTQLFFADEPGNAADPLLAALPSYLAARLVAAPAGRDGEAIVYTRDIVLRGTGETPFFDDLDS